MSTSVGKYFMRDSENKAARESLRDRVYKKTPGKCWYCGGELTHKNRSMDHVIPRSRGGRDEYDNLVPTDHCNKEKGDMSVDRFRGKIKWKLAGMPIFTPEQVRYIEREFGVNIEPVEAKFWFEVNGKE